METERIIFIDSNFWVYLFDQTTPEHTYVKECFGEIYDNYTIAVNTVIMIETMHYLVKKLGVPVAKKKWEIFSSIDFYFDNLLFEDLGSIFSELCDHTHLGIGSRDATILSFLKKKGIKKICTHDNAFKRISGLEVIDPIPKNP